MQMPFERLHGRSVCLIAQFHAMCTYFDTETQAVCTILIKHSNTPIRAIKLFRLFRNEDINAAAFAASAATAGLQSSPPRPSRANKCTHVIMAIPCPLMYRVYRRCIIIITAIQIKFIPHTYAHASGVAASRLSLATIQAVQQGVRAVRKVCNDRHGFRVVSFSPGVFKGFD